MTPRLVAVPIGESPQAGTGGADMRVFEAIDEGREVGVTDGLHAFAGGIGFILTTPATWPFACVPMLMALLLTCGLGGVGFWAAGRLSTWLVADGGAWQWLTTIALGLLFLGLAVVVGLVLARPLSSWALEAIARRQERALTGRCSPEPGFLLSLWISLRCAVVTLAAGLSITVALFVVSLLFPPAALVTIPLNYFVVGWLLAWDFVDYPLGLRGLGLRARLHWVSRHFSAFTAFGLAWATVLIVPGMVLLVLPMGVAGATRLVVATDAAAC